MKPDQVTGKIVHSREASFQHIIRWDYALFALVVLYVLWKFAPAADGSASAMLAELMP